MSRQSRAWSVGHSRRLSVRILDSLLLNFLPDSVVGRKMYLALRFASATRLGKIALAAAPVMVSSSKLSKESRKATVKSSAGRLLVSRAR